MAAWGQDKARNVVDAVVRLADLIRRHKSLSAEDHERALDWLHRATYDGTKILAFFAGVAWDWNRVQQVCEGEEGLEAYEELALEYGVISETTLQRRQRERGEYLDDVAQQTADLFADLHSLIEGERSPNRTQIHELLRARKVDDPKFRLIEDLTESVTMGELSWEQYTKTVGELIARHVPALDGGRRD